MPLEELFIQAAVIPDLWGVAVNKASEVWDADAVSIVRFSETCSGLAVSDRAATLADRYLSEGWYKADLRAERALPALRNGREIVTDMDLFRPEEIKRSPFYSQFLHPSGFGWFAASLLSESMGVTTVLAVHRYKERDPFNEEHLARIQRSLPSLRRASQLALMGRLAAANGTLDSLERLNCGAILIDWLGRVIRVNKKAESYMDSCFHLVSSRLHVGNPSTNRALQSFLTASIQPLFSGQIPAAEHLVIPRPDTLPLVMMSYPVVLNPSDIFQGARAILLIKDPATARRLPKDVLRQAFRFTPSEHRVASLLLAGFNTQDAAMELGVGKEAIRFHIKSMLAKTGTNQQTQLVGLLACFSEQHD